MVNVPKSQHSVKRIETRGVAQRTKISGKIEMDGRTIGSNLNFRMTTDNLSKSGVLISTDAEIPFRKNTIVELTVDPSAEYLSEAIHLLGKVIRRNDESSPKVELGIMIISDCSDMPSWFSCVEMAEKNNLVPIKERSPNSKSNGRNLRHKQIPDAV